MKVLNCWSNRTQTRVWLGEQWHLEDRTWQHRESWGRRAGLAKERFRKGPGQPVTHAKGLSDLGADGKSGQSHSLNSASQ